MLKFLDAARAIYDLLAAGEKRMAIRADIDADLGLVRARFKSVAASAGNGRFDKVWVDIFFHF